MTATQFLPAAFLLIAGGAFAQAAPPPRDVGLNDVLELAVSASPRLALEQQNIAAAAADRIVAAARPNPVLSYGRLSHGRGERSIFDGSRQQDFRIELPLPLSGQRAARIARADLAVDAARARAAAGASSLAAEAGAAFVALLAAQEQATLLEQAGVEAERLRGIVAGREASGFASRYDLARIDVELGSLRARVDEARADVIERAGVLAGLLALPEWQPRAVGGLEAASQLLDTFPRTEAGSHPAVVAATREEAAARQQVDVARRERYPVPALSVGRTWSSSPFGSADYLGFSVEVPILDDRRGPVAQADAEARAASLRREVAQAEANALLVGLERTIAARALALRRFDAEAAERLQPLRQMAEDAYRLGRGSVLDLVDAARSQFELQSTRIELAAALLEARVRLHATGIRADARR